MAGLVAVAGLVTAPSFAAAPTSSPSPASVTALRADLADGDGVAGCAAPGTVYEISAPLVVATDTTLDMTGCTVRAVAGAGFNLLRNAAVTSGGRDSDITVIGGTWERGANGGSGNDTHNLFFRRVDRLTVTGVRVTSAGGKYAITAADVTQLTVRDITLNTFSDGVHVTGPARDVDIRNVSGTTGDDQVAFTARDYGHYDDVHGDIENVTVSGVYARNSLAALKIISGTGTAVRDVRVDGLFGTTRIRPVAIISDLTGPTVADNLEISGVHVQATDPAWAVIWLRGVASSSIVFRDVFLEHPVSSNPMILIDRDTAIDSLTIDGWTQTAAAMPAPDLVGVYGTARIGALRLNRLRAPATWTGRPVHVGSTTASVGSAITTDLYVTPAAAPVKKK